MNTTVLFIGLVLFFISTFIHLYYCFIQHEKGRAYSKIFPTLFLGITILILFIDHPFIYISILCGTLGDLFLLFKKHKIFFYIGTGFFFLGHICHIILLIQLIETISIFSIIFILLSSSAFFIWTYFTMRKKHHLSSIIMGSIYFYSMIICFILGILLGIKVNPSYFIVSTGFFVFIISDWLVVKKYFDHRFKRDDFYIMLTYIAATSIITIGFLLPYINL